MTDRANNTAEKKGVTIDQIRQKFEKHPAVAIRHAHLQARRAALAHTLCTCMYHHSNTEVRCFASVFCVCACMLVSVCVYLCIYTV